MFHRAETIPCLVAAAICCRTIPLDAQTAVRIREIGPLERVSTVALQSVTTALAMPGGNVLVNDGRGRKLLMLDSTLSRASTIADTTDRTGNAYGRNAGVLFRFRGDTALLVDMSSLVGLVIGPSGSIVRVMAFPPPPGHPVGQQVVIGGRGGGFPGIDAQGKLVYFNSQSGMGMGITTLPLGMKLDSASTSGFPFFTNLLRRSDSAPIYRVDLVTRRFDTAARIKVPFFETKLRSDANGGLVALENTPDPLPVVDEWTMLADGTIAVVRGREYRVEWLGADGKWESTARLPFEWKRLSDERRNAIVDSAVRSMQEAFDRNAQSGRGRGGNAGRQIATNIAKRPDPSRLPEYVPPFQRGDVRGDADGNIWIRTSTVVNNRPVYDIVSRRDGLFDRVQLPPFRTIVGFAKGAVFMAMQDSANVVHLERARIK